MKKKILLTTLFATTFLFVGCMEKKEPITLETFENYANNNDLISMDIADTIDAYEMDAAMLISDEENTYQIEFYDFPSNQIANNEFNHTTEEIDENNDSGVKTNVTMGEYSSFTTKVGDEYYAIVRVDDTMIYAYTSQGEVEKINAFLEEMGYK